MFLKSGFVAVVCTALLVWNNQTAADEYRAEQYLGLDLSKALLSPKPLGPPAEFAAVPVEAMADRESGNVQAKVSPEILIPRTKVATRVATRVAHVRAEKPRPSVGARLARRHGNPMDAEAFDARIQVWPCKSGGICNWTRQAN